MENKIQILNNLIKNSKKIVFFGGAGVSTESGIPDFRSKDGIYNQKYDYPPEEILSHNFFMNNPKAFYKFYKDKLNSLNSQPNITHYKLAKLEKKGKVTAIVTQNIDGLHQKAGSKNVLELHGSILRNYCMKCHKFYDAKHIFLSDCVPVCDCGGMIKPDVVLYGEPLPEDIWQEAIKKIEEADLLIVGGTSLSVYPAALLISYFKNKNIVLINRSKTNYDNKASLIINDNLGNVFSQIKE